MLVPVDPGEAVSAPSSDPASPLSSTEERLVAALEASRAGTWRWDIVADRVTWDAALCRLYGLAPEQAPRTAAQFLELIHPDDRARALSVITDCVRDGAEIEYEFRVGAGAGVRWIYDRSRVVRDGAGRPLYMTGACLDVTSPKATEERLREAIADRDLLLRELGHRVANSLQLVMAILGLEGRAVADPVVRGHLAKAMDRVGAVARLHSHLYRREHKGRLRLDDFLRRQIGEFRGALTDPARLALDVELEPVEIDIDRGLRIGLVLNEILTNAAKHAFPDGRSGLIRVVLQKGPGMVRLTVSDDGVGLPARSDDAAGPPAQAAGPGTGSSIIERLCRQLGATLRIESAGGTAYDLQLPA